MKKLSLLVLLALAGCSRCGQSAASSDPIERVIPKGAVGAVIVPALGDTGQKLHLLEQLKVANFAAGLQGFASGKAYSDAFINQLGFDFRDPKSLEMAGLDAKRSASMSLSVAGQIYVTLPVRDASRFALAMSEVAKRRLGAPIAADQKFGEVVVKTFAVKEGTPAKLGYVVAHGYAIITDTNGIGSLAGFATLTETDSLVSDVTYQAELKKLPTLRDVLVYLPTGTPALARGPFTMALGAIGLSETGLSATVNAQFKQPPPDLSVLTPQPDAKELKGYLPTDAFLVARYSGSPAQLAPWVKTVMGRHLNRAFDDAGFDVKAEVLEKLEPGVALSLSLSDAPPIAAGMPSLDLRQTNPFTYAHLSGVGRVKDEATSVPTLEKIASVAPKFGAQMTLKERPDGQKAMLTTYSQGEGVHFAPKGSLLFFASPVQRLDALVKSDGKGGPAADATGDAALDVKLDLRRLAQSVRELPESAWGLGGFAIKATTVRWLDATDDLKAISLRAGQKDGEVQVKVELALEAKKTP